MNKYQNANFLKIVSLFFFEVERTFLTFLTSDVKHWNILRMKQSYDKPDWRWWKWELGRGRFLGSGRCRPGRTSFAAIDPSGRSHPGLGQLHREWPRWHQGLVSSQWLKNNCYCFFNLLIAGRKQLQLISSDSANFFFLAYYLTFLMRISRVKTHLIGLVIDMLPTYAKL